MVTDVLHAMGYATIASGSQSTAMGSATTAASDCFNSTAMGSGTCLWEIKVLLWVFKVLEHQVLRVPATGYLTTASEARQWVQQQLLQVLVPLLDRFGNDSTAPGNSSTAMGHKTTAPSYGEMAIGTFNTTTRQMLTSTAMGERYHCFDAI